MSKFGSLQLLGPQQSLLELQPEQVALLPCRLALTMLRIIRATMPISANDTMIVPKYSMMFTYFALSF
jgi:hypothetical protein